MGRSLWEWYPAGAWVVLRNVHRVCMGRGRGDRGREVHFCGKGKRRSQTREELWAGTCPHSPAVPCMASPRGASRQRAQHPSVELWFEARCLSPLRVIVAGRMFLCLQRGNNLSSGWVHLGNRLPAVTLKPPGDEAATALLCTRVTTRTCLSTTTSGLRLGLADTRLWSCPCLQATGAGLHKSLSVSDEKGGRASC